MFFKNKKIRGEMLKNLILKIRLNLRNLFTTKSHSKAEEINNQDNLIKNNSKISCILKSMILSNIRTKQPASYFFNSSYKNLTLITDDNIKIGAALFEPEFVDKQTKYVIFLHGSATNRDDISEIGDIKFLSKNNFMLLIPDYRDFGDSEGTFEKDKVSLDVKACFDFFIEKYSAVNISIIGFSFGTAISAEFIKFMHKNRYFLNDAYKPTTLILISPFTSFIKLISEFKITSVLKYILPAVWKEILYTFNFDTINNLEYFTGNLYLFHGEYDPLIKSSHSEEIQKKFNCYFKILQTDHMRILLNDNLWKEIENIF